MVEGMREWEMAEVMGKATRARVEVAMERVAEARGRVTAVAKVAAWAAAATEAVAMEGEEVTVAAARVVAAVAAAKVVEVRRDGAGTVVAMAEAGMARAAAERAVAMLVAAKPGVAALEEDLEVAAVASAAVAAVAAAEVEAARVRAAAARVRAVVVRAAVAAVDWGDP